MRIDVRPVIRGIGDGPKCGLARDRRELDTDAQAPARTPLVESLSSDPRCALMFGSERPPLKEQHREGSVILPLMRSSKPVTVRTYRIGGYKIPAPRSVFPFNDRYIRVYQVTRGDIVGAVVGD